MSQRIIVVGAGGHGQVVADILLRMAEHGCGCAPVGYVDDRAAIHGLRLLELPVLGSVADLSQLAHDAIVVAVGDNLTRRRLYEQLLAAGEQVATAIHPRAVLAPDAVIGRGVVVCAGAIVNPGSQIGDDVILNTGCTVDHHNQIGDHVHVGPGAHLGGDVAIGEGALIGIGATVMPQRRVGAWAIVGAAALAHRDVPAGATWVGVPGRGVMFGTG